MAKETQKADETGPKCKNQSLFDGLGSVHKGRFSHRQRSVTEVAVRLARFDTQKPAEAEVFKKTTRQKTRSKAAVTPKATPLSITEVALHVHIYLILVSVAITIVR